MVSAFDHAQLKQGDSLMKKMIAVLAALVLSLGMTGALADETPNLSGVVIGEEQSGVLIQTEEFGQVLVKYSEETYFEGSGQAGIQEAFVPGAFLIVAYNGAMTRSLPPQITADIIYQHKISGTVTQVTENGVLVDQGGEAGEMLVHLQEGMRPLFYGCPVEVYFSGVVALSYPSQIGALHYVTPTLTGTVTKTDDGFFMMTDDQGLVYRVNCDDSTHFEGPMQEGGRVSVYYNGRSTFSIPAQVYGIAVFQEAE